MATATEETDTQFERRLCRVIAQAETTFFERDFVWQSMEAGQTPSSEALACVADAGNWYQFVPARPSDTEGRFCVVLFRFSETGPSAIGFVAWLHSHLRTMGKTGAIVICGKDVRNSDSLFQICQGALDYWACPVGAPGERFLNVIHALIARGQNKIDTERDDMGMEQDNAARRVWVFFYGSNISLDVLRKVEFEPTELDVAKLWGFDIDIRPLANLVHKDGCCVYGTLVKGTHAQIDRLYGDYVQAELGATYRPEAVLCEKLDGSHVPALCFIAEPSRPSSATKDYMSRILEPAKQFGFPDWYVARLEEFSP